MYTEPIKADVNLPIKVVKQAHIMNGMGIAKITHIYFIPEKGLIMVMDSESLKLKDMALQVSEQTCPTDKQASEALKNQEFPTIPNTIEFVDSISHLSPDYIDTTKTSSNTTTNNTNS